VIHNKINILIFLYFNFFYHNIYFNVQIKIVNFTKKSKIKIVKFIVTFQSFAILKKKKKKNNK